MFCSSDQEHKPLWQFSYAHGLVVGIEELANPEDPDQETQSFATIFYITTNRTERRQYVSSRLPSIGCNAVVDASPEVLGRPLHDRPTVAGGGRLQARGETGSKRSSVDWSDLSPSHGTLSPWGVSPSASSASGTHSSPVGYGFNEVELVRRIKRPFAREHSDRRRFGLLKPAQGLFWIGRLNQGTSLLHQLPSRCGYPLGHGLLGIDRLR